MILKDINTARQFLPSLNLKLDNSRFNDFFRRAQQWLVARVLGEGVETALEADISLGQDDPLKDLRLLCQRVIAEIAMLDAIPEMDLQLTEAGFAVQNNDDFMPASHQRVDRFRQELPKRIIGDIDALVRYLLTHDDPVCTAWKGTAQFKRLTSAFLPYCEEYVNAKKGEEVKYEDFCMAKDNLTKAMYRTASYYVSSVEIDSLLSRFRGNTLNDVQSTAVGMLKEVVLCLCARDIKAAKEMAMDARRVMLSSPDDFPAFKASPEYGAGTIDLGAEKTANFL